MTTKGNGQPPLYRAIMAEQTKAKNSSSSTNKLFNGERANNSSMLYARLFSNCGTAPRPSANPFIGCLSFNFQFARQ
jgi:hypothetical protein